MGLLSTVLAPKSRVTMLVSVGEHEAGLEFKLPAELADRYIARGYAAGGMSREYNADELVALRGNPQVVTL